eukprot:2523133-Pleurochrysis_carterae.AAC.1
MRGTAVSSPPVKYNAHKVASSVRAPAFTLSAPYACVNVCTHARARMRVRARARVWPRARACEAPYASARVPACSTRRCCARISFCSRSVSTRTRAPRVRARAISP